MAFTIYQASVPMFETMLKNLSGFLVKAASHAEAGSIDVKELLDSRLHPDMFELRRQVQIACDHAKGASARLSGTEIPVFPDNEVSIADLQARIQKTLDFMASLKPEQFTGGEDRHIKLVFPWATYEFSGSEYLTRWALPNFFFHVTTAYDILRHRCVSLGKADFIGQAPSSTPG